MNAKHLQQLLETKELVGSTSAGAKVTLALDADGELSITPDGTDLFEVDFGSLRPGINWTHMLALQAGHTLRAWYNGMEMSMILDREGHMLQFVGGEQIDDQHTYNDDRADHTRHVWYVVE